MVNLKEQFSWKSFLKKDQTYVLKTSKPLLGGFVKRLQAIPYTTENISCLKLYCSTVRNFTNTSLRKCLSRLEYLNWSHKDHFVRFWLTLKVLQILEPSVRPLCYELLRNGYTLEYQLMYQDTVDSLSESYRFYKKEFLFKMVKDEKKLRLITLLFDIQPEFWIPMKVFPLFEYSKEGKMHYAFKEFKGTKSREFRKLVQDYLRKLDLKSLFLPPPDLCLSVTSSRYNDGGVVRRDYEKVQRSLSGGFLYQKFNPKPLETREVWLPDKSTKINNAYWMLVGRQILKSDPTYPNEDPMVTWESIKSKLNSFGVFDMSGFGFQYPREYLVIIAEEICNLYYSNDLYENLVILKLLFSKVTVEMPDGSFVYPPRGIGLGYYEDLKTIGINALIQEFDPISVYGDQGILPSYSIHSAIDKMRDFEFIIPDDKYKQRKKTIKWSGWIMNATSCTRPKLYFNPLVSLFSGEFHWERKMILRSYSEQFPDLYDKYDKILPFQYELAFGYEFTRGDSLWNFSNGGVSTKTPRQVGLMKSTMSERLISPKDSIDDNLVYSTPFFTDWKRADSKSFSKLRRETYLKTHEMTSSLIMEYINPIIELNKNRVPKLSPLAALMNDGMESKLILNYGLTSGKFTYGLNAEELYRSLVYCGRAQNPFEAFSTGGYRTVTPWCGVPLVSSDLRDFVLEVMSKVNYIRSYIVERFDTLNPMDEELYKVQVTKRSKILHDRTDSTVDNVSEERDSSLRRKYNVITLSDISDNPNLRREDKAPVSCLHILDDRLNRNTNLVHVDTLSDYTPEEDTIFPSYLEEEFDYSSSDEESS